MANFIPADYIDVQERITRFWEEYENGRIETDLMSPPDDFTQCRYVARVYRNAEDGRPAATGWAFELAGGGGANKTSHEENCETSAIGRALANLGYATRGADRPSRQEMEKVQRAQNPPPAERRKNPSPPPPPQQPRREAVSQSQGPTVGPGGVTEPQIRNLYRLGKKLGWNEDNFHQELFNAWGVESTKELTKQQASDWIKALKKEAGEEDGPPQQQPQPNFGGMAGPEEPPWMATAPPVGEPGNDRYSA